MSTKNDLIRSLRHSTFDEQVVNSVVQSNDDEVFAEALERADCPPELLVDLSQAPSNEIRRMVASHRNTPRITLERMSHDSDRLVAAAAKLPRE